MYVATYIIDIAALLYLARFLYTSTMLNHDRKKPFLMGIVLTVIIILAEAGTIFAGYESVNDRNLNIVSNVLGFSLTPMIPIVIACIFDRGILSKHKLILVPTIINVIATVLSPRFGLIFHVDAGNQYVRGNSFFIFITVYIVNFLLLVVSTIEVGKMYNYPITKKLVALSFFTILGTSIQLVVPLAYSSWHCVTLALLLYFLLMSEFDSSFDTLTSLYNRAAFDKATKQLSKRQAFSVVILDINDFKNVNDTYGHDYGDTVIQSVAAIIRRSFHKHYTCYRFGGDEFAIIGRETNQKKLERRLRLMTKDLAEMRGEGKPLPTISYGYSIFYEGEIFDFHKILKEADAQMYRYKKLHKERLEKKTSSERGETPYA